MNLNWWTFLFQTVNFLVLAFVLHRLVYRPLHEAINRRREANERAQVEADKARADAAALERKVQEQINDMERQRQDLIRQARQEAEKERKTLLAEADKAVQTQRAEFQKALERERTEALQRLKAQLVGMAIDLSRRLLHEVADTSFNRQLSARLITELGSLSETERTEIRTHWRPADGVVLESSAPLENGDDVVQAIAAVLGQSVQPALEVKPELLGGVRLRIGGHIWDASLAGCLEDARQLSDSRDGKPGAAERVA